MSIMLRRHVPLAITFIVGFWIVFDFFFAVGNDFTAPITSQLNTWVAIITVIMIWLGCIVILTTEWAGFKREQGWMGYRHLIAIGSGAMFFIVGAIYGTSHDYYQWIYVAIQAAGHGTIYSTLFFTMISATYRVWRIRTGEALAMVLAGSMVLIGNTPMFAAFAPWVENLSYIGLRVINTAGMRGLMVGGGLGASAIVLRVLLGRETGYMGIVGEE